MNTADAINQENEVSYFVNKPVSIFRTYNINLEQFNRWNFNGTYLGSGGHLAFKSEFKNQWQLDANLIFHSSAMDTKILRGGYDMMMPYSLLTFGGLHTDYSKKIVLGLDYSYEYRGSNSAISYQLNPGITFRPIRTFKIGVTGDFIKNTDDLQYVATTDYLSEKRYILGTIDQNTIGITLRMDLNITPEFSIQYYGSPYVTTGHYSAFKTLADPDTENPENVFHTLTAGELQYNPTERIYELYDGIHTTPELSFADPDFNFRQFRSNLVARWEYKPGSVLYLVWTHNRTSSEDIRNDQLDYNLKGLFREHAENVFLIKFNYWFSL
jgi:hypothetical protein